MLDEQVAGFSKPINHSNCNGFSDLVMMGSHSLRSSFDLIPN